MKQKMLRALRTALNVLLGTLFVTFIPGLLFMMFPHSPEDLWRALSLIVFFLLPLVVYVLVKLFEYVDKKIIRTPEEKLKEEEEEEIARKKAEEADKNQMWGGMP